MYFIFRRTQNRELDTNLEKLQANQLFQEYSINLKNLSPLSK
jgi:hypothetical protein